MSNDVIKLSQSEIKCNIGISKFMILFSFVINTYMFQSIKDEYETNYEWTELQNGWISV